MAKRHETVPEDLLKHLVGTIPGFEYEAANHQFALAKMVWFGDCKRRQHLHYDGAMSFGHSELEMAFGRSNFLTINDRVKFFTMSKNWSRDCKWTKGYWFSDQVRASRRQYLDRGCMTESRLLMTSGAALKTVPAAVASKDMKGKTTTAWTSAKRLNLVKVNLDALKTLQDYLRDILDEWRAGRPPADPVINFGVVERLFDTTAQVIRLGNIDVSGHGFMSHHYEQAASGRLYATGISLQTVPSLIKQAALVGLWEYDFSNCHYAILNQMAARFGYECIAIRQYLATKESTRRAIAEQAEITESQAKTCLIAIMYGARASEWHENAIPEAIGIEAAKRLYLVPQFKAIQKEIGTARNTILEGWARTANGSLTNAFGKAIPGKAKQAEQMAHLIQGVEAKALQTAIKLYPEEIVLLQHDGFAATTRLDVLTITDDVLSSTGYQMELEEELIQVDPDAYFLRHPGKTESKSKAVTKPMPLRV